MLSYRFFPKILRFRFEFKYKKNVDIEPQCISSEVRWITTMARICPLYGRDDQGVVKVTWISDGVVVGKYVPFNELYIVEINIPNQSRRHRDIQKLLVNLAYTIIVVVATVYCLDVLVKWFRKRRGRDRKTRRKNEALKSLIDNYLDK